MRTGSDITSIEMKNTKVEQQPKVLIKWRTEFDPHSLKRLGELLLKRGKDDK